MHETNISKATCSKIPQIAQTNFSFLHLSFVHVLIITFFETIIRRTTKNSLKSGYWIEELSNTEKNCKNANNRFMYFKLEFFLLFVRLP